MTPQVRALRRLPARRTATGGTPLDHVLDHVRAEPSRTWSIIVSLYGDAIVPRGGTVWLGTVLQFFQHLGIGEGVVRTAMSRLASDGWLVRRRIGRNSFYALSPRGHQTFRDAATHIYRPQPPAWGGHFDLVIPEPAADRDAVRRAMSAAGFGTLAPDMWLAPAGQPVPKGVPASLHLQLHGEAAANRALAARGWPLDDLAAAYSRFMAAFAPLHALVTSGPTLDDLNALSARVLLIHEFRRVVLRDPILPAAVLPAGWPGSAARTLCAEIYRQVLPASERWLDACAMDEQGRRLPAAVGLDGRFRPPFDPHAG